MKKTKADLPLRHRQHMYRMEISCWYLRNTEKSVTQFVNANEKLVENAGLTGTTNYPVIIEFRLQIRDRNL